MLLEISLFTIILYAIFCKVTAGWCYSKVCLNRKTAIITGGNSGVGYQTALALASRGCRVIIADIDDSSRTVETIIRETDNPNIVSKRLNLGSFKSIREFAQDIIKTESKLHILINNAGIGTTSFQDTEDGLHKTMQVNYYGHFLLTHLLLDLLKKTAPSRIVFTSSIAAYLTTFNLQDMNPSENRPIWSNVYANSKLCEVIAANRFAMILKGTGVTVNSFHPGGVRSSIYIKSLAAEKSFAVIFTAILTLLFGKSCEQGAQTAIYLACAKEVENVTGEFFIDCWRVFQPLQIYRKELCKEVWNMSMKLTGLETSNKL